jgi:septal ring factor EnvC (AmiA/AmiB activator)
LCSRQTAQPQITKKLSPENQVRSFITNNGWCRTNYHKDGKRRFGRLSKNGLCCECDAELAKQSGVAAEKSKITRLEQKIVDLEQERERLNSEIKRLRSKLQTLIHPIQKSGVTKS